eukprot:4985914-Pleurochrysis_carterae.AAC.3
MAATQKQRCPNGPNSPRAESYKNCCRSRLLLELVVARALLRPCAGRWHDEPWKALQRRRAAGPLAPCGAAPSGPLCPPRRGAYPQGRAAPRRRSHPLRAHVRDVARVPDWKVHRRRSPEIVDTCTYVPYTIRTAIDTILVHAAYAHSRNISSRAKRQELLYLLSTDTVLHCSSRTRT